MRPLTSRATFTQEYTVNGWKRVISSLWLNVSTRAIGFKGRPRGLSYWITIFSLLSPSPCYISPIFDIDHAIQLLLCSSSSVANGNWLARLFSRLKPFESPTDGGPCFRATNFLFRNLSFINRTDVDVSPAEYGPPFSSFFAITDRATRFFHYRFCCPPWIKRRIIASLAIIRLSSCPCVFTF